MFQVHVRELAAISEMRHLSNELSQKRQERISQRAIQIQQRDAGESEEDIIFATSLASPLPKLHIP